MQQKHIIVPERKIGPRGTVTLRQYHAGALNAIEPYVRESRRYAQLIQTEPGELMRQYYRGRRAQLKKTIDGILLPREKAEANVQRNIIVYSYGYGYDILVQFLNSVYNGGFSINNAAAMAATTDGTTAIITGITSTATLAPGMMVSGVGILPYSTIISIDSSTSITISQATNVGGTNTLYFFQTQQLGIGWGEIGTGATTPATADTALTTPFARMPVSYAADDGYNTAGVQFFFPDALLTNQTYLEFGTFVGGGATLGSGNMFNHALFASPYSKSAGTDTTVEVDFEFGL